MNITTKSIIWKITDLYKKYGYNQFKMNKFEEYDIYVNNKDFLKSDKMITFTDTNGKLLAMKPDVTISIIKNSEAKNYVEKVYYNENVYRVSEGSYSFKEIMQSGLECIGDIDMYNICETVLLAAKTLECVCENFVLDVSHLGIVSAILKAANLENSDMKAALEAISSKNLPSLKEICERKGLSRVWSEKIYALVNLCGPIGEIAEKMDVFCIDEKTTQAVEELKEICAVLSDNGIEDKVRIDFSVVNDMSYYNGIVLKGYVEGVPMGVLSGGEYDGLVKKMGKDAKGLGFALYLDMLERLFVQTKEYDADVLITYEKGTACSEISKVMRSYIESGKTVTVQGNENANLKCREKVFITKAGEIK
ncbi:MAG: ATP phosphoribosyltransferase regulatory subunit [Clostridia bacterium]|nr:ATP phosphoribosyltransferase regulatory subunit [Clostridia bacterium]